MSQTELSTTTVDRENSHREQFSETDSRRDDMADTIERWIDRLTDATVEAAESPEFREWLDVQSRFHDYSFNNTLLIQMQCPDATRVAGFNTWKNEFNRYVKKGESAIWIWGPIITDRCPTCENSEQYHDKIGCEDETDPEEWDRGLVGFKPVPVFDVSQTEGDPLPELETAATGDATGLMNAVMGAADRLGVPVEIVPPGEWEHGRARGVMNHRTGRVKVRDRENTADKVSTLIHELAHARLHGEESEPVEREKREVEAEATAYVVGTHYGLDMRNSAFYLAAWAEDDPGVIRDRLDRISRTAQEIIEAANPEGS